MVRMSMSGPDHVSPVVCYETSGAAAGQQLERWLTGVDRPEQPDDPATDDVATDNAAMTGERRTSSGGLPTVTDGLGASDRDADTAPRGRGPKER